MPSSGPTAGQLFDKERVEASKIGFSIIDVSSDSIPAPELGELGTTATLEQLTANGRIDLQAATGLIGPRTRLLAVSQSRKDEMILRGMAERRGLCLDTAVRPPPPEPSTCCGRGCNGCVWESYDAALMFWYEDAGALLN